MLSTFYIVIYLHIFSHLLDYYTLKNKRIDGVYSDNSKVYIDNIWKGRCINQIFHLNLEKIRFKKTKLKSLYSTISTLIPKSLLDFIVVSKNQLINDYISETKSTSLQISPAYHFPINLNSNKFVKQLSKKILDKIVSFIESKYFLLSDEHKKSVFFIIDSYLARANNDLSLSIRNFHNTPIIITSSGTNYYNRLMSTIARKQGTEIWRFHHGGERCFFDESHYWNEELFNADLFISYGKKWSDFASEIIIDKKLEIKAKSFGSFYHKKVFDTHFSRSNKSKVNILYIPNSFVGEARQFPFIKIIDPLLFDWQRYLIELLQNNGFDVIYKKHPKGFSKRKTF